jgi:aspartate aminotransferase-like enzyme
MKLFIPGPVDVRQDVLDQLSKPIISHRSQLISNLQTSIETNLKLIMETKNSIVISSSSGTGAMEMALRSLTLKRALILSNGAFGDRFYEIATHNQIPAELLRFDDGQPIDIVTFEAKLNENLYDTITITHNETSTSIMNNLEELSQVYKKYPDILVILDTVSSLGGVSIKVDHYDIDVCVSASQKAI